MRESVIKKLQIPLKDLLVLRETCKDAFFKNEIIIPVLKQLSSQATLDELISMITESLLKSDESIQVYIKEKIKSSSLRKLTSILAKHQDSWLTDLIESDLVIKISTANLEKLLEVKFAYKSINEPKDELLASLDNLISHQLKEEVEAISLDEAVTLMTDYEDEFFIELIEPDLEKKISTASLGDILAAKSTYASMDEPKSKILKLLEHSITKQVEIASFEDLINQRTYWNEIPDELIQPILRKNISAIVSEFINSESFDSAGSNSRLLVRIAEHLSRAQWESILEAFFQNGQLNSSFSCYGGLESLFKKSLEFNNSVQPYWLTFRENLNKLSHNDKHRNSLKRLIDSHI